MSAEMKNSPPAGPILAYPQAGPRVILNEMARCIEAHGVPRYTARSRCAAYATRFYIHTRARASDGWNSRVFEFSDIATATVLSAVADAGVADSEVNISVSEACYAWTPAARDRDARYLDPKTGNLPRHPIDRAVVGTGFLGETWVFDLDIWRDAQTGERTVSTDLREWGQPKIQHPAAPETALPMAGLVVVLDHIVAPVARLLRPADKGEH